MDMKQSSPALEVVTFSAPGGKTISVNETEWAAFDKTYVPRGPVPFREAVMQRVLGGAQTGMSVKQEALDEDVKNFLAKQVSSKPLAIRGHDVLVEDVWGRQILLKALPKATVEDLVKKGVPWQPALSRAERRRVEHRTKRRGKRVA